MTYGKWGKGKIPWYWGLGKLGKLSKGKFPWWGI